jgi:carboxylesterase
MTHIRNPHLDGRPFFWPGNETGVLLLHGLTATTAEVRLLAEHLRDAGYTVSAPLLPGHGTTPEELNSVRWRDWAWEAAMAYELIATHCDQVFVGGESTGGALALHLAMQYPEIAGLLCYAPAVKLAMPPHALARLYASAPLVDAIPKRGANQNPNWQGYTVYPLWAVVELVRLGREVRYNLPQVKQPVLVVQGRNDATIDPLCGQIILEGVQSTHKELHWLENSAHVIVLEEELPHIVDLTLAFMIASIASYEIH